MATASLVEAGRGMMREAPGGIGLVHRVSTRAQLDHAMDVVQPHLRPIVKAVRDHDVDMAFARQQAGPFRLPNEVRPVIIMVGDDMDSAMGPPGFHLPSIRRCIRGAHAFAVISGAPHPDVYTALALAAVATRRNTMIIETRPEQEIQWVTLVQKLAPKRFIWLSTVTGGHA